MNLHKTALNWVLSLSAIALCSPLMLAPGFADEPPPEVLPPRSGSPRPAAAAPCLLAPHNPGLVVLSDRPLFIWQGQVERIALRLPGEDQTFWQRSVAGVQQFAYDEAPLQRGQTYEWLVYYTANSERPQRFIRFQVMPLAESQAIASQLASLGPANSRERVTPQSLSVRRMNLLIQENLWADVMRELFTVQDSPGAIAQYRQNVVGRLCGDL